MRTAQHPVSDMLLCADYDCLALAMLGLLLTCVCHALMAAFTCVCKCIYQGGSTPKPTHSCLHLLCGSTDYAMRVQVYCGVYIVSAASELYREVTKERR